jgi:adenylate cyclase
VLLPLALLFGVVTLRNSGWPPVELWITSGFDGYIRARPRPYQPAPVRIIDIDEDSLAKLGQWPWPRKTLARLTDRLGQAGAAAIAFDVVFAEPDRLGADNDRAFAEAIKRNPVVLGTALREVPGKQPVVKAAVIDRGEVERYAPRYRSAVTNIPLLAQAASGIGSISTGFEADGVIRRVPVIEAVDDLKVPVLWAEALRVAQGARGYKVVGTLQEVRAQKAVRMTAEEQDRFIKEHGVEALAQLAQKTQRRQETTGFRIVNIGHVDVPTDQLGRVWLYPTLPASQRVIPAWKVLDKSFDPRSVEGCILFIGTSAEGLKDLRATPLDPAAAGVTVHANLAEQALLHEHLFRKWWSEWLESSAILLFGVLVTLLLSRFGSAWCLPFAGVAVAFSILAPAYAYREKHLLLDRFFPALATLAIYLASSIISYLKSEMERRQVKGAFSRYMSPALVEQLAKHPERLKLGGETREMTWHFCDIRGFTTISEQFDPHGLVQFINRFLTPMTELILEHQGVIDKYMGDCIMAFWNAPLDDPEHARHACQAALKMHEKLAELNAAWEAEAKAEGRKYIPIHIGTGLNTGSCVVGNMGSDQRFDYSVLGDEVNLASRLEGQSKTYGVNIVIGPNTRAKVPEFAALELDLIKVKGKTVPVRIYALLGGPELAQDAAFKAHEEKHARMIEAYRAKRFDETRALLAECRKTDLPLAKLYDLYEHRLDAFVEQAPPADWDGTFTATTK